MVLRGTFKEWEDVRERRELNVSGVLSVEGGVLRNLYIDFVCMCVS